MANKVKVSKLFIFTMTGYYQEGFQMAWDWLTVIISYHFWKAGLSFLYDYQTFTRSGPS